MKGNEHLELDKESKTWWDEIRSSTKAEDWCCKVFKDVGIDWIQYETWDFRFHRIKLNFCPHCGRRLTEK